MGDHRLMVGDATDAAAVSRLLDGAQPTLLVTDPPYGVQLDLTWRDAVYNKMGAAERPYMRIEGNRNTSLSGDTIVDWSPAFELVPSLEVGYVWHAGAYAAEVAEGLVRIGFEIVAQVIWDKGLFAMGRSWYHWAHEPCWVVRKKGAKARFLGKRNQATIWRVQQRQEAHNHPAICCEHQATVWRAPSPKMIMAGSREDKLDHPAQKPVVLYDIPILNHAGDVYDPFGGCGTSVIAAEQQRRRSYVMELEPRYAQIIIERWQAFTGQVATRG